MSDERWQVSAADAGMRLDKWLASAERLGSRSRAATALERGRIFVDETEQNLASSGRPMRAGEWVRHWEDRPGSARRPSRRAKDKRLEIVHEDDALLVLSKPAGLLTVPRPRRPADATLMERVHEYLRGRTGSAAHVVHRLDRDTTGLIVVAKTEPALAALKRQFLAREPERIYWAIVYGCPEPREGTWEDTLLWDAALKVERSARPEESHGGTALARYRVLDTFRAAALIEVALVTGKRNQIRVQAGLRGIPLVGERKYVYEGLAPADSIPFGRQALHALRLAFRHPTTGRLVRFEAALPNDLKQLLARLRREREAT